MFFGSSHFADFCTIAAMLCAAACGGFIHVVLTWGTNNMSAAVRTKVDFDRDEICPRTIGSKPATTKQPIYNS
jgi:hypothetical protein